MPAITPDPSELRELRIAVVSSRFNVEIADALHRGALAYFTAQGLAENQVDEFRVPGAWELPVVAKTLAASGRYDAVCCLGAIIRGETDHYEHVATAAATGIAQAALDTGVPVIFGVLACHEIELARERAGLKVSSNPNVVPTWPYEATVEMALLMRRIKATG